MGSTHIPLSLTTLLLHITCCLSLFPSTPPRFKAYIYPNSSTCYDLALGELGCGSDCYSWYSPDAANYIQSYAHELGHNMNLRHASENYETYADLSSAMGYCCRTRCFNPPNNWQLGWAAPLATLTNDTLLPGHTQNLTLPLSHTTVASMVRIITSWQTDYYSDYSSPIYWLGYRGGTSGYSGYDIDLPAEYANKVNVYRYDGTTYSIMQTTSILASLSAAPRTSTWSEPSGSLVVQVTGISATGAAVAICRCDIAPCFGPHLSKATDWPCLYAAGTNTQSSPARSLVRPS
jgi:hypothetical protein